MIKYEIFPSGDDQAEKDPTVRLKLRMDIDGAVVVYAVHENGIAYSGGNLVRFEVDGQMHKYPAITYRLPFILDGEGRIIEK